MRIENVHERFFPAPPRHVCGWLERAWSGGEDDVFPRDRFASWRRPTQRAAEPGGGALFDFGHAQIRFRARRWDGTSWEAEVLSRSFRGSHGFLVEPEGEGTRVQHRLQGTLHGSLRWRWPLMVRPLHDWAIEALLDRLGIALARGLPPDVTLRAMSAHARLVYALLERPGRGSLSGRPVSIPNNWGAEPEELAAAFPCDALLVPPDERLFRALTVQAPAARVFRWLCQLRVAPYSYDWIDNWGRHSPRQLTAGLEELRVGQPVMGIFELASFERDRHLTLRLADAEAKRWFGDIAGTYAVQERGSATRLLGKLVVRHRRSSLGRVMRRTLPWGDLIMMRKQFLTLKQLAEREAGAVALGA